MRLSAPVLARSSLALAVAASLALVASSARAQPKSAEALFEEGRKLMKDPATLSQGCRALEESYKIEARGHTLLNLAECHRREGKTATAWAEFDKAMNESEKVGFKEAAQTARQLRDDLAATLSTLTVTVPPKIAALEGLTVEVNATPLPREQWNKAAYFDPGPAEITAIAKGHKRFTMRVVVAAGKDQKVVTLALEAEPKPEPPKPKPPPPPPPKPVAKKPIWPWIVGGAGVGLMGASIAFIVDQQAAGKQLDEKCGAERKACPAGFDFNAARGRELRDFGLFVGLGAAGLVAVGVAGVTLGLAARRGPTAKTSLLIGPSSAMLQGEF